MNGKNLILICNYQGVFNGNYNYMVSNVNNVFLMADKNF